jgi:Tn7-like transposition protein D
LLEHPRQGIDLHSLYNRYLGLLIERGLATYTGSIRVYKLLTEFGRYYSPSLLRLLHCEFTGSDQMKTNWLLRLVRSPKYVQHPLYHLLLMQLLSYAAEEFFKLPNELSTFGKGPWPCLNSTADHFRKSIIVDFRLGKRLRNNRPVGIFSCECGFTYARLGPDSSPKDRFRIGRMLSFGPIWEAKLKELWKEPSISISEMGGQLGVDPLTARRHAVRLKLPFCGSDRNRLPLLPTYLLKNNCTDIEQHKRDLHRSSWLSVINQIPQITMEELRKKLPRDYAWLLEYDSEWLKKHRPLSEKRTRGTSNIDWNKRDAEYVIAVRASALHLKSAPEKSKQITKTAIGRDLGAVTLLQQKLHKMPLTAQVLAVVVENHEQYAVRRIWRTADSYAQQGMLPRRWQLIRQANVYRLRENLQVKKSVDAAMKMLESELIATQVPQMK